MSGKILARVSALSLVMLLAACGGDGDSTPLVDANGGGSGDGGGSDPSGPDSPTNPGTDSGSNGDDTSQDPVFRIGYLTDITDSTTFVANEISSPSVGPVIGGTPSRLQVAALQENSNELVLGTGNTVTFFSACASAGWATFSPATVSLETGVGYTEYEPDSRCEGQDVLYARINEDFSNLANATVNNQSVNGTSPPSSFRAGSFDSNNSFQEGVMSASRPTLVIGQSGADETDLRLAIVDSNDELPIGNSFTVEFTSMCLDADRAEVQTTGQVKSGQLLATYTPVGPSGNCGGTDSVFALIGTDNQIRAKVDISIAENEFAIGSFGSADLFTPSLASAKSTLDYNLENEPSTQIRSIVGTIDSAGSFSQFVGNANNIEFFSTCIDSGLSTIETTGTTTSGELISTYKAQSCVGNDTVYARIEGTNTLASTTVKIIPKQGQELALGNFNGGTFNPGIIGNTRTDALPLGVQTKLFLSIADAQTEAPIKGQPLTVQFDSQCGEQADNTSPLSAETVSVSLGYIEILYTAQSCGILDKDLVIAQLVGVDGFNARAEATIRLADLPANSLTANLPEPNSIAPSFLSTEGRETTSTLRVQLKDNQNNGVSGEVISFRLDNPNNAGSADSAILTPVNGGSTDSNGFAEVKIKAANNVDNVVFRVVSSFTDSGGNVIETFSAPIAVNTKLPVQERFSLGTSNFAPDAQSKNGVQVQLTLRAADDQGNRIRGNTIVNFETYLGTAANKKQAGSIDPECILDNEGRCTVTWESLNIVSTNEAEKFATIRAYTQGIRADGTTGIIESSTRLLMTTSAGIQVKLTPNSITSAGGPFCAEASVDILGNSGINAPPVGTTLEFEVTGGTLIPASSNSFTLGSSSALLLTPQTFEGCTFFEPDPTSTDPLRLTVTATPPAGSPDSATVVAAP